MALTAGARFGPHELTAAIGAGGMGEVYRAKDSRLKREVALKVLHSSVAHDAERLARFQREAEVLASLNHPDGQRFLINTTSVNDASSMLTVVLNWQSGSPRSGRN